jgi:hypothetical protein
MELKIDVDDELMDRIKEFKRIYDIIVGEESELDEYIPFTFSHAFIVPNQ